MLYVANIINTAAITSLGATSANHKAANDEKNIKSPSSLEQLRKIHQDINFTRTLKNGEPEPPGKSASPIYVVSGLNKWLHSVKDIPGFRLIENITLEEGENEVNALDGEIKIGENLFKKESKLYLSDLNHEFEHIKDIDITIRHLKALLSTMDPKEIKNVLSGNCIVLLNQHYEKVLDSAVNPLKEDQKFKSLLATLAQRTKDHEVARDINIFLSKEISKKTLGGLGHKLFYKEERQIIDKYLKMNYGVPSLYSFMPYQKNLYRIGSRLVEINGSRYIRFYPELSAEFAGLSQTELKTIYTFGTKRAKETIERLLQLAYDAGKIEKSKFIKITGKVPTKGKIYKGPTLLP